MDKLPVAPIQTWVTSASHPSPEALYGVIDTALVKDASSCCVLSNDRVVVGALTELDLDAAVASALVQVTDLKRAPFQVMYVDDPLPLEPFYRVVVTAPVDFVGDVMADLNRRMASFESMSYFDDTFSLKCGVPISSMIGYDSALAKISNGRGEAAYAFTGYRHRTQPEPELPPAIAARA
jgi:translation elongation factor EF-G